MSLSAGQVIKLLGLQPLPAEGGMWAQTWRDEHSTGIYFLLRPHDFSALHRLQSTELWHFYAGTPARMLLLNADGTHEQPLLGNNLEAGERPVAPVAAGTWMGASTTGAWSLLGTTMAPPFTAAEFELGTAAELVAQYPAVSTEIAALTRPAAAEQPLP